MVVSNFLALFAQDVPPCFMHMIIYLETALLHALNRLAGIPGSKEYGENDRSHIIHHFATLIPYPSPMGFKIHQIIYTDVSSLH